MCIRSFDCDLPKEATLDIEELARAFATAGLNSMGALHRHSSGRGRPAGGRGSGSAAVTAAFFVDGEHVRNDDHGLRNLPSLSSPALGTDWAILAKLPPRAETYFQTMDRDDSRG